MFFSWKQIKDARRIFTLGKIAYYLPQRAIEASEKAATIQTQEGFLKQGGKGSIGNAGWDPRDLNQELSWLSTGRF